MPVCRHYGLACRRFNAYVNGAAAWAWRLEPMEPMEPMEPRADIGEDLGLLRISDDQLADLIEQHGVYGAADVIRYSYHRLRKRIDASPVLARYRRSALPAA